MFLFAWILFTDNKLYSLVLYINIWYNIYFFMYLIFYEFKTTISKNQQKVHILNIKANESFQTLILKLNLNEYYNFTILV